MNHFFQEVENHSQQTDSNMTDSSDEVDKEKKRQEEILGQVGSIINTLYQYNNQINDVLSPSEMVIYHQYFKEQLLTAKMLVDINESKLTINKWIGTYLLAAKQEARNIVQEAKIRSQKIVSAPLSNTSDKGDSVLSIPSIINEVTKEELSSKEVDSVITPMTRLAEVKEATDQQYNEILFFINERSNKKD